MIERLPEYRKAVVAALGALVAIAVLFGLDLSEETERIVITVDTLLVALGVRQTRNYPVPGSPAVRRSRR